MIELQIRILNGSDKGPLIFDNLVFTEKAFWKIDQFREATGEKLVPGQRVIFNADDCINRRGRVVVTIDSYQGRSRNKVDHYVLPGEESPSPQTVSTVVQAVGKNELDEPVDVPF
jgi:hypothetical protein